MITDRRQISDEGSAAVIAEHDAELRGSGSPVLLVGEHNPQSAHPEHCLWPWPERCAGWNLRRILGISEDDYTALARTNLCVGIPGWKLQDARDRAVALAEDPKMPRVIVALGSRVSRAFGHMLPDLLANNWPPFTSVTHACADGSAVQFVYLPHPSGRNLIWNNRSRWTETRALLRDLVPGVVWGGAP